MAIATWRGNTDGTPGFGGLAGPEDSGGGSSKAHNSVPSGGGCCGQRFGAPFGNGYRAVAHAYRHQSQPLSAEDLWVLAGLPPGGGTRGAARQLGDAFDRASQRGGDSSAVLAALSSVWIRVPLEAAALEAIAVLMQVVVVLFLGVIFRDLAYGSRDLASPGWLPQAGHAAMEHVGVKVAPLVAAAFLAQLAGHSARHRRAVMAAEATAALQAWLFRRVAHSERPDVAGSTLANLIPRLPELAAAWAKRSWARGVAHFLGAALAACLLVQTLGNQGLFALPAAFAVLGVEAFVRYRTLPRLSVRVVEARARRTAVVEEMLEAASAIKMFAWERSFFRRLGLLRGEEREALRRHARAAAVVAALAPAGPLLALVLGAACIGARWALQGVELWQAVEALAGCALLGDQLRRLRNVLLAPRATDLVKPFEVLASGLVQRLPPPRQGDKGTYKTAKYAVSVEGMRFSWPEAAPAEAPGGSSPNGALSMASKVLNARGKATAAAKQELEDHKKPMLSGLDACDSVTDDASVAERARRAAHGVYKFDLKVLSFQVRRNSLVALVGATGCGKSTMFAALTGTCRQDYWGDDADTNGVCLAGRVAHAPQQPVLLEGRTIRDNILFGLPYDKARYEHALGMSTLSEDLAGMPLGDGAPIEELKSDASKMAVQIARIAYSEAEIVLLDDPFVAMESQRALRALHQCVVRLAKERTVLLATQNLALLADIEVLIVVIRNGTIFEQGEYKTLVSMPTEFSRMLLISKRKDAERARARRQLREGVPCPFLAYEVDGDPMDDAFPQDKQWETIGFSTLADNKWNTFHTGQSDGKWVSQQRSMPYSGSDDQVGIAPWDTQWSTSPQNAAGVTVRDGMYTTHTSQGTRDAAGTVATPRTRMEQRGGGAERRRGFAFDAPAAKEIQDFFDSQRQDGFAPPPMASSKKAKDKSKGPAGADALESMRKEQQALVGRRKKGHGTDLSGLLEADESESQPLRHAAHTAPQIFGRRDDASPVFGGSRAPFGGDDGDFDPLAEGPGSSSGTGAASAQVPVPRGRAVRAGGDAAGGLELMLQRQMQQEGLPEEGELEEGEFTAEELGVLPNTAERPASAAEWGDAVWEQDTRMRRPAHAVSSIMAPTIGADGTPFVGGDFHVVNESNVEVGELHSAVAAEDGDRWPMQRDSDQGELPDVYEQDEADVYPMEQTNFTLPPPPVAAEPRHVPELSDDGLEPPPDFEVALNPIAHLEEVFHTAMPPPPEQPGDVQEDVEVTCNLRTFVEDGVHAAGAPREERRRERRRGEDPDNRRGGSSERRTGSKERRKEGAKKQNAIADARLNRLDVLERALKEKNDKIAELERRVAKEEAEKEEEVGTQGAAVVAQAAGGNNPRASPDAGVSEGPMASPVAGSGAKGAVAWLFVRGGGLSALLLILLFLGTLSSHLGICYLAGNLLVDHDAGLQDGALGAATSADAGAASSNQATPGPSPANGDDGGESVPDDSGIIFRGFETTSGTTKTTTTTTISQTTSSGPATTPAPIIEGITWAAGAVGHYCKEVDLDQNAMPAPTFAFDSAVGWYWQMPVTLHQCQQVCEDQIRIWGCRYVSWGGPPGAARWCYVHRSCDEQQELALYDVHNVTVTFGSRLRRLQLEIPQERSFWKGVGRRYAITGLGILYGLLALTAVAHALVAARVGLQGGQVASARQLRVILAAAAAVFEPEQKQWLRARMLQDVNEVDNFLPVELSRLLPALAHVLGIVVSIAVVGRRQVLLSVALAVLVSLSAYLHVMRLPLLAQLRRLQDETQAAAALHMKHLIACHELMRTHGRLGTFCDGFAAACRVSAQAAVTRDNAERWLHTRVQFVGAALLGMLAFSMLSLAQEGDLAGDFGSVAPAAVALLLAALLPAPLSAASRHGASLHIGLAALQRMRQLWTSLAAEELESPALRMRLPSNREQKDLERRRAQVATRNERTLVLGDAIIERGTLEQRAAALFDLARLEQEQGASVAGFPLERVADDWPYFGAIEMEDVLVRYGVGMTPALQEATLRVPAMKSLLLVGPKGSGKTTLLRALLRLAPLEAGKIIVDCVDVRCVGLTTLRSRIAFVPQETIVFRGSWRSNLDPVGEFEEPQIRLALRLTRLQHWLTQRGVESLDSPISEEKAPLHAGLRALIGLCRAMLRLLQKRSKLLVLDRTTCQLESTSDADLTALILRFCRRREAAVLQASRRLVHSPIYDVCAAIRGGRIIEQGPPRKLWGRDGAFRAMAREQGVEAWKLTKPEALAQRLTSMWAWDVSPQEEPEWGDEFEVSMKKAKPTKNAKSAK